ncbi:phytanoyl-CoA dioxygenase family protein [Streptomyces sp. NPDC059371]|uniref:phytanoyl-CoA dioxygenase family protein n=1 Tax=Streptomyces sp. NPDC059371 TaxID=3346812 RepID=UPI0036C57627
MIIGERSSGRVGISDLTIGGASDDLAEEIVGMVKSFGVAFVPGWLTGGALASLQEEFDGAFAAVAGHEIEPLTSTGKDISKRYGQTRTGLHLKYHHGEDLGKVLPRACEIFTQEWMASVAALYLGKPCTLNRHLVLCDDFKPNDEIMPYHYDEMGTLKFLVYLDDVDRENGAFHAIPGTTQSTRRLRERDWLRLDDVEKIRVDVFDSLSQDTFYAAYGQRKSFLLSRAIAFEAPAGSLLVFDTDTVHRAGTLVEGRRRRVVRSSSYRGYWP